MPTRVLAVDCGATSVRVCAIDLDGNGEPDVLHRWAHSPVRLGDGSLRWDWPGLIAAVEHGLSLGLDGGPVASIGIDTWGVDYGLLDRTGSVLSWPHCYRSDRTSGWRSLVERLGAERLYRTTGVQLQPFNTLFQLSVHDPAELPRARRLLMLPELIAHHLTDRDVGEVTSAATTGLIDIVTGSWSEELLAALNLDRSLFPEVESAGRSVGTWRRIPVTLVGGHDTASAVASMQAGPDASTAFVATGSWLLVGVVTARPCLSARAAEANLTNEPAVGGGVRLQKNVTGLHLLERLRAEWGNAPLEHLLAEARAAEPETPLIDPDDAQLAGPGLEARIRAMAGPELGPGRGPVVRCLITSLAAATARALDEITSVTGVRPLRLIALGGGVRNHLLLDQLEEFCGLPLVQGPAEATALGNALVQGVGIGHFADLTEAHRKVGTSH